MNTVKEQKDKPQPSPEADLIDQAITNLGRTDKLLERAEKEMEMARALLIDKEESTMTHPIDGTPEPGGQPAGPEKPPWPNDPTKDTLPPLTAPLVEEYVTRIRLMEKAFGLAYQSVGGNNSDSPNDAYQLNKNYHAILQALLEESGLSPPEGTDGKDQEGR